MTKLESNIEQRAYTELNDSTKSQTLLLANSVEQQYTPLEAISAYLAVQDNPKDAFFAATGQTNAVVRANSFCMLGYADMEGNAYSYEGEGLGSIVDRQYYKDATSRNARRSIEYLETTTTGTKSQIVFGTPVIKDNRIVGILFAAKDLDVFQNAMFSGNFGGSKLTLITDGEGTLIAANGSRAGLPETDSFFDRYTDETMSEADFRTGVTANMRSLKTGNFRTESEYGCYMPLRVSNWYVFGIVEKSAVTESYTTSIQGYKESALTFGSLFAAFVLLLLVAAASFARKNNKGYELVRRQYNQLQITLSELQSAIYNYDIATQKIEVSENFAKIFGQELPEDWLRHLDEEFSLHPETDFEALIRAKSEVELTGKSTQLVLQGYNNNHELRSFRTIMAPLYRENGQLSSICGMIIDVTERRDQQQFLVMEQERLTLAVNNLATLVMSCNLTKNTFRMINYENYTTKAAPNEGCFDELISIGASTVPEDDRQSFINAFSRESLLAAYERGERKVELEHKQLGDDGVVRWIRTSVLFVNNHYDDDIYEITFGRDITESKQYEALLQKTFDLTVENMPSFVGKWIFKDGDILLAYANRKYLEFLGTTEEEAYGKSIFKGLYRDGCVHGEEKSDILEKLYACEREKKPISSVNRGWKMNGEQYWLMAQSSYFGEEDGCSVYYGTITDITEQISTQQELSKTVSELKNAYAQVTAVNAYRNLMDYSHSGGMLVRTLWNSGEHKVLYVSPGLLNAFGYTEEEYMASIVDGYCTLQHPDDLPQVDEANRKLNDIGDAFALEYRIRHKDGHYLWVIEHALVATMPNGEKVLVCLTVDVSEQKKLEEKLRISQEEYRVAASLSSYAVLSYDVASRSYEVISNKDETHNFLRTNNDVPEYAISIGAVAPESAELIRDIFQAIDRGEQREKCIVALCTVDGKKYWLELSYTIIFDDGGKPLTAILCFDDVTAKMQAEALFNISSTFLNYSKNATKLIVVNLTKRTIRYETEGAHGLLSKVAETRNSADAVKYYISRMVVPEDEEACRAFFAAERFIKSYQNGITEESFEYRGYTADNIPHWYNAQTRLLESAYTHDITLYVVLSDINEQKLTELELMRRAQTDSLTGFLNRESFDAEIQERCKDPDGENAGIFNAIVLIDIDKFKTINDNFGHDTGDEAMRQVAKRIRESLRDDDIVARFGGDEFIALLPHMPSTEMIEQRCAKICDALNFELNEELTVSGSLGIAVWPEDGLDFPTLLKKADLAMYQAKRAGGNRCAKYSDNGVYEIASESTISPISTDSKKVFARTFGYFDLFINGIPLHFTSAKEKELLAILIDRNGGTLTAGEAISILGEAEPAGEKQNTKYRKLAMNLKNTLEKAGVSDIIISNRGVRSINTAKIECDYFQFLKGDPEFRKLYHGSYMTNYSWSEETIATLDDMI